MLTHPESTMRVPRIANAFDFEPRDFATGEFPPSRITSGGGTHVVIASEQVRSF